MRTAFIVLVALLLLCLLPVLVALGALAVSGPLGCIPDGPGFTDCTLFGTDVTDAVNTATLLHWFGLATLPFAALVVLALLLLGLVQLIRILRR